jgi:hypothetical protein
MAKYSNERTWQDICNRCSKRNCHKKAQPDCSSFIGPHEGFKFGEDIPQEQKNIIYAIARKRHEKR